MSESDKTKSQITTENTESFEIIIIEGDDGIGKLIQTKLNRIGYRSKLVETGTEALKIITGAKNEILIVDYKLPDMNGKELVERLIKKHDSAPNFLTLTGYGDEKVAAEMLKLGSHEYIVKEPHFLKILPGVLDHVCKYVKNEQQLAKTESDLQKNLELLKETGELARVGGWEIDLKTNKVYWTDATKKIHEVPDDFVPDLSTALSFFPNGAEQKLKIAVEKAIEKGKKYSIELPFVTAKGKKLWVITKGNPQMENRKCVRMHGTFQDITKRKKAELELKKKTAILKRTEKIANVGSWDWDVATDEVTWSEELFRIFKLDPKNGAVSYADHSKIYTPESMKKLDAAVQECLKKGESYQLDLEIKRGDGKTAFCTVRGFAKKDDKGEIVSLYGSFQDITDRKVAEEKMKAAYEQLQASEQQLKAANQQLMANNQQLISSEQQLKAANQQLAANDQQLRAANQQLVANEIELIKSKERAERFLNVAAEIILSLDKEGNITLLNESGHQLLGYRNQELIGKNWFDTCLPKNDVSEIKGVFKQIMSGNLENVENYESKILAKSGDVRTILWHNSLLKDDKGKISGTLSSGENITKRKKVEELLAASERKYRSIMDNSSSSVFIKDLDGKYLYINRKFEEMHEISNDEVQAMTDFDLFDNDLAEQYRKNDLEIIQTKKSINFEEEVPWKGEMKTVISNKFPLLDQHGKAYAVCGIATDITERKKAEEQIEINEERFRKSQKAGHIGSWEYNLQTEEFWGSDESLRIYNLDSEKKEFSAEEVMNIVVEADREKVNQAMIDLVNVNKPYDIEFEIIPRNTNERKIIHSIADLQKDENGMPNKVTGVLRDITVQKTIEKQLIEAKEKAEEADMLKSAFLANMSHEIRTPMNGILGFTDLLKQQDISGEKQVKFIDIIQKSGNRMLETVNALIDISKIETGQVEVSKEDVYITQEVQSLFEFFNSEAKQKGLAFNFENRFPERITTIHSDRRMLISIMTNLIKNAIKYTDEGFIKIGLELKADDLHFYIKDSGIGVPKNRRKAIFNRFEQADIKDTRAFQGSGLGLAIVKAYVEMLNGKVGVESEEGKGSVFWMKLPVKKGVQPSPNNPEEKERDQKTALDDLKILIAEDDSVSSKHLTILLGNKAKQLLYSCTGRETIEMCKKHPDIDLILMDVKMPDIDGYDATREIKKFNTKVKIIAQTAYALSGEREKALAAGCDEYISKPIDGDLLFGLIQKTLNKN